MLIGYARVSTHDQDTALQLDALHRAGVAKIYQEKASGANIKRPVLWQAISTLGIGDTLVFYKLDRVARGLSDLLRILECIDRRHALVRSLTEPIDTTTPFGVFTLQMLGAFAQLERSIILERSRAGQAAARARGVHCGRPLSVDAATAVAIVADYATGFYTLKGVALRYGVSDSVVKRLVYKSRHKI